MRHPVHGMLHLPLQEGEGGSVTPAPAESGAEWVELAPLSVRALSIDGPPDGGTCPSAKTTTWKSCRATENGHWPAGWRRQAGCRRCAWHASAESPAGRAS
ncbi:unnamed protein product [Prorocentrum cordatum]|uniref:Uncharacterized protein n=1 Tax=Prorocentrum cordatum TaxID=2364126 RepID=A0ABN9VD04_9DINO|nr:unnamed protein product [Polarella glacialis]